MEEGAEIVMSGANSLLQIGAGKIRRLFDGRKIVIRELACKAFLLDIYVWKNL